MMRPQFIFYQFNLILILISKKLRCIWTLHKYALILRIK